MTKKKKKTCKSTKEANLTVWNNYIANNKQHKVVAKNLIINSDCFRHYTFFNQCATTKTTIRTKNKNQLLFTLFIYLFLASDLNPPFIHPIIHPSIHPYIPWIHLFTQPFIHLSSCLFIHPSLYPLIRCIHSAQNKVLVKRIRFLWLSVAAIIKQMLITNIFLTTSSFSLLPFYLIKVLLSSFLLFFSVFFFFLLLFTLRNNSNTQVLTRSILRKNVFLWIRHLFLKSTQSRLRINLKLNVHHDLYNKTKQNEK